MSIAVSGRRISCSITDPIWLWLCNFAYAFSSYPFLRSRLAQRSACNLHADSGRESGSETDPDACSCGDEPGLYDIGSSGGMPCMKMAGHASSRACCSSFQPGTWAHT